MKHYFSELSVRLTASAIFVVLATSLSSGQILVSLLFGDKLNSDKIEFGLDGGYTVNHLSGVNQGSPRFTLNLGMYFDFQLSEHYFIHTGVILRSKNGVRGLTPYPVGNPNIDPFLEDGELTKELDYIYIPGLLRYRFSNFIFLEGGPQIGILTRAKDHFEADMENPGDELIYDREITDDFNRIDAGITIGAGIKLKSGEGITTGFRYYFGLTNVLKNDPSYLSNRIGYLYVSIPIGVQKTSSDSSEP